MEKACKVKIVSVRKFLKWAALVFFLMIILLIVMLLISPVTRCKLMVRYLEPIDNILGGNAENKIIQWHEPRAYALAMTDLMLYSDPELRCEAARLLDMAWAFYDKHEQFKERLKHESDIVAKLQKALEDPVAEVSAMAGFFLGWRGHTEMVPILLDMLSRYKDDESACSTVIVALGNIGDATALAHVLPFVKDSRENIRYRAIGLLSKYRDARIFQQLIDALASGDDCSLDAVRLSINLAVWDLEDDLRAGDVAQVGKSILSDPQWCDRFSEVIYAATISMNNRLDAYYLLEWIEAMTVPRLKVEAYTAFIKKRGVSPRKYASERHYREALWALESMGPQAKQALPAIEKLLSDIESSTRKDDDRIDDEHETRLAAEAAIKAIQEQ